MPLSFSGSYPSSQFIETTRLARRVSRRSIPTAFMIIDLHFRLISIRSSVCFLVGREEGGREILPCSVRGEGGRRVGEYTVYSRYSCAFTCIYDEDAISNIPRSSSDRSRNWAPFRHAVYKKKLYHIIQDTNHKCMSDHQKPEFRSKI